MSAKSETPRTDKAAQKSWYDSVEESAQLERELNAANDKLADAHARISSDLIARQFLVDENNKWRECANKLADCNLKTVPLICLEPDERVALSTLENLNLAAAMPNVES
jgi:hypothetical protein